MDMTTTNNANVELTIRSALIASICSIILIIVKMILIPFEVAYIIIFKLNLLFNSSKMQEIEIFSRAEFRKMYYNCKQGIKEFPSLLILPFWFIWDEIRLRLILRRVRAIVSSVNNYEAQQID